MWQSNHRSWHTLLALGTVAFCLSLTPAARAASNAPDRGADTVKADDELAFGVGLTAGIGDTGVAALMGGVDVWLRPKAIYAVGLEAQAFMVDNGADPHYCHSCLEGGQLFAAVGELRIPSQIISGFARVGVGPAFVKINHEDVGEPDEDRVDPVILLAAGPELTLFHVFLRLRGTATLLPSDSFVGYGAELGAVF